MDAKGVVLAPHAGPRTLDGFRATGTRARAFVARKEAAANGTPQQKVEFLIEGLGIGYFSVEDAARECATLKQHMTDAQTAQVQSALLGLEIESTLDAIDSRETMLEAGAHFAKMAAAGRTPADDARHAPPFWGCQLERAIAARDLADAERVLAEAKKRLAGARMRPSVADMEERVDELRADLEQEDG